MKAPRVAEAFLNVRVKPRAVRSRLLGPHGDGVKVAVRAVPERGRANVELLRVLADALGMPAAALTIVGGEHAQDKRLRITGIAPEELRRRIAAALGEGTR